MTKKVFRSQAITLAENNSDGGDITTDIQVFKAGVFSYWEPGDMVMSREMFAQMILNFQNKVRGVDIAVDYGHNAHEEAAGWIENLYMGEDQSSLWAKVKWTKEAQEKIADKQYRYISGEFAYEYENEAGVKCGPTLFGAALTNRPFLKEMECVIEMNEKLKQENLTKEKIKMDEVKKLNEELSHAKLQLAEKDKEIETLKNDILANEKKIQEDKKTFDFNELLKEGKVVEAQREAYMLNDVVAFSKLAANVNLNGVGNSEEKKNISFKDLSKEDAELKIKELAEIKVKGGLKWREAIKEVLNENKELAEKYN